MNPFQLMQEFQKFKQDFEKKNPNADPQKMVQDLINSGQMSMAQFDQLRAMANSISGLKM